MIKLILMGALLLLSTVSFGQWVQTNLKEPSVNIYERAAGVSETENSKISTDDDIMICLLNTKTDGLIMSFSSTKLYDLNGLQIQVLLVVNNKNYFYNSRYYYNEDSNSFLLFDLFDDRNFLNNFKLSEYMYVIISNIDDDIHEDNIHQFDMKGSTQSYNFVTYKK